MHIEIRGENIEVTSSIREYIETKLERVQKYFNKEIHSKAHVNLKVYKKGQKVEVTIPISKQLILRAEQTDQDIYAAMDLTIDKIERQIRKYKTKINRKFREREVFVNEENLENPENDPLDIIRTKKFSLKPMDIDEAILQMEMLGHNFYVFLDSTTEKTKTIYKRNDGKYGLIETE